VAVVTQVAKKLSGDNDFILMLIQEIGLRDVLGSNLGGVAAYLE
jgi:hypothetical protein